MSLANISAWFSIAKIPELDSVKASHLTENRLESLNVDICLNCLGLNDSSLRRESDRMVFLNI